MKMHGVCFCFTSILKCHCCKKPQTPIRKMTIAYPCSLAAGLGQCRRNKPSYLAVLRRLSATAALGHAQLIARWRKNASVRHGPLKGMAGTRNARLGAVWRDAAAGTRRGRARRHAWRACAAIKQRAVLGIEPRTSRTQTENHTTRPNSQLAIRHPHAMNQLLVWPNG